MIWRTLAGTLAVCPAPHCVATFTTINTWGRIKAEYAEYSGCTYRLLVGSVLWCSLTNIWRLNTVFFNDHTYQTSPVPLVTYQGRAGTEFCGWWGLQVQVFKVERWARSAGRNNTSYIGQLGKARAIFLDSTRCTTCAPCQLALVTRITTTFSISPKKIKKQQCGFSRPKWEFGCQNQLSKSYWWTLVTWPGPSLQSNCLALEHVEFHHLPRVHACCKLMKGLGGNLHLTLQRVRGHCCIAGSQWI